MKHFRHMLEAQNFVIFTDHKPLTYAFSQRCDKCTPRQFNHLDFISQFTTDTHHISGKTMCSLMLCLAWKQSAHQALLKIWQRCRQQTRNSSPFCKGPPPSGSRRSRFLARMWFYTPQAGNACTFPKPSDGKCLTLSTVSATSEQGQQ